MCSSAVSPPMSQWSGDRVTACVTRSISGNARRSASGAVFSCFSCAMSKGCTVRLGAVCGVRRAASSTRAARIDSVATPMGLPSRSCWLSAASRIRHSSVTASRCAAEIVSKATGPVPDGHSRGYQASKGAQPRGSVTGL